MKILVLNSGSSSLKFRVFDSKMKVLAWGLMERIAEPESRARIDYIDSDGSEKSITQSKNIPDHKQAIMTMGQLLQESCVISSITGLSGIGHRVVHGGEIFTKPTFIDENVIKAIEKLIPLAPLHNPANLTGIRVAMEHAGDIPQVAVFDTAFHRSIPKHAFLYAIPYELYEKHKIRRYGFHGTSHGYVARQAANYLKKPIESLNIITLHLGNGASASAIKNGRCIDTSMGFTPLEGLIMGTRCGDIDPAIIFYIARQTGMEIDGLDRMLNKESGLKGICRENDMRTITNLAEQGDDKAKLALDMFCHRLKKYIGAYMAVLGGVDAIVFTGGIGENSPIVREMACKSLDGLGIALDKEKNKAAKRELAEISLKSASVRILIVPTDEEYEIAIQTLRVINECNQNFSNSYD